VRRTALAKIVVMGAAGIFGLINTRLITSHFGADAYAQYGLLASFPNLMPFTDLGIGAVILNTVAGSSDLRHDAVVRRRLRWRRWMRRNGAFGRKPTFFEADSALLTGLYFMVRKNIVLPGS